MSRDVLNKVAQSLKNLPPDFTPHPKLQKLVLDARIEMVQTGQKIDWGCAEMLAIGSLLLEGKQVAFTGQDVEHGTFSHRHSVLHDYNSGVTHIPLNHIDPGNQAHHRHELDAFGVCGVRLRVGFCVGRSAQSRDLGSAVRRFCQRHPHR